MGHAQDADRAPGRHHAHPAQQLVCMLSSCMCWRGCVLDAIAHAYRCAFHAAGVRCACSVACAGEAACSMASHMHANADATQRLACAVHARLVLARLHARWHMHADAHSMQRLAGAVQLSSCMCWLGCMLNGIAHACRCALHAATHECCAWSARACSGEAACSVALDMNAKQAVFWACAVLQVCQLKSRGRSHAVLRRDYRCGQYPALGYNLKHPHDQAVMVRAISRCHNTHNQMCHSCCTHSSVHCARICSPAPSSHIAELLDCMTGVQRPQGAADADKGLLEPCAHVYQLRTHHNQLRTKIQQSNG